MVLRLLMYLAPLAGIVGLYLAGRTLAVVRRDPAGEEATQAVQGVLRNTAEPLPGRRLRALAITAAVTFVAVSACIGIATGVAFLIGAGCAAALLYRREIVAGLAGPRTREAARSAGEARAMRVAFEGGAIAGISAASAGLVGLGVLYWFYGDPSGAGVLAGFALGTSAAALMAPATETDLFESYCGALVATILIAAAMSKLASISVGTGSVEAETLQSQLMMYPLAMGVLGLLASLCGIYAFDRIDGGGSHAALRYSTVAAGAVFVLGALIVTATTDIARAVWWALTAGSIGGMAIGVLGQWENSPFAGARPAAVSEPASAALAKPDAAAIGSRALPVLAIVCGCLLVSAEAAGIYGVAIGAVGMLATVAAAMAIGTCGSIAAGAGAIEARAGLDPQARAAAASLDSIGATITAGANALAAAASALTAVALLLAYALAVNVLRTRHGQDAVQIVATDPRVIVGFFLGAVAAFFAASWNARVAEAPAGDVRAQTESGQRAVPALVAVLAPVFVGTVLGPAALGGMLAGATVCGTLLALTVARAGGAWRTIEQGIAKHEQETEGTAQAAVSGDDAGGSSMSAAVPSINVLVKVMSIVSLVLAPLLA